MIQESWVWYECKLGATVPLILDSRLVGKGVHNIVQFKGMNISSPGPGKLGSSFNSRIDTRGEHGGHGARWMAGGSGVGRAVIQAIPEWE